jgi:ABC-type multidrug transport system fused ATPase/permease subunit
MQTLALIEPAIIMAVVDTVVKHGAAARDRIWPLAGASLAALLGIGVTKVAKDKRISHLNADIYHEVQQLCADKLLRLSMSYHLKTNSGELMGKITRGTGKIIEVTFFLLIEIVPLFIQTILAVVVLSILHPVTALALLPAALLFGWLTHRLKQQTVPSRQKRHAHDSEADRRVGQAVYNILTVQSFGREDHESSLSRNHRDSYRRLFLQEIELMGRTEVFRNGVISIGRVAMLVLCAYAVFGGEVTIGMMILMVTLAERTFINCYRFGGIYDRVMDAQEPVQRVLELMAEPEVDPDPVDPKRLPPASSRRIELRDVGYAYPKTEGRPAFMLRDVNLKIEPGEMLGIVGPSGNGKSTLVKLILGFYRPTVGSILIDGIDIRDLAKSDLRRAIGVVSQEVDLFDDTIRANIAYGKLDATDDEIVAAAKAAHAHDFIMEAGGYDALLGNRGLKLSGGQRQRLSIARALLAQPSILVFDEATSSVDAETIWAIKRSIDALRGGCTMIVISHQLSTVQDANRIAVVTRGRLEAVGRHHDLLGRNPTYRSLVLIQQRMNEGLELQLKQPMHA